MFADISAYPQQNVHCVRPSYPALLFRKVQLVVIHLGFGLLGAAGKSLSKPLMMSIIRLNDIEGGC